MSLLLEKHMHLTDLRDKCHFYKLGRKKFLQPNLEENFVYKFLYVVFNSLFKLLINIAFLLILITFGLLL
jgi:hypothetical protein